MLTPPPAPKVDTPSGAQAATPLPEAPPKPVPPHLPGLGTAAPAPVYSFTGPSGLTPAIAAMPDKEERIILRRLEEHRANMQATVEGIKALAEDSLP